MSPDAGPDTAADDARRHARLSELVLAALARPEPERTRYVGQACADDPSLAAEVLSLLVRDDRDTACLPAGELLAQLPPEAFTHDDGDGLPERGGAAPDTRAPGYTLLRVLGQGGMGTVYEAEQHAPRRRVALKVLSGLGVAGDALRRFAREAQILGQLQHPGLCQVHEIGRTTSGEPFFAMELVDGRQLLEHAEHAGLDRTARLVLASAVCDAVAHAHERGVVHRDLKPDNILVTADGRAKVVDFGVARATAMTVASTLLTSAGAVMGTVAYMSPEQAAGRTDVDARADVFALGVVVFELLTGARPCQTTGLSLPQALHVIQRDDHALAALGHPTLDGDLRTILAKALEHDPARRYPDAGALAADIRRHLAHQPIVARPPSVMYRVTKFTRRHRTLVAASVVVFAALLAGALVALDQARRANRGEELASRRAEEADRQSTRATLTAVQELIDAGRFQQAADEFARVPATRRGWVARHFAAVLDRQFGEVLRDAPSFGAALSADGRWAFTVGPGDDGRLELLRLSLPDGAVHERLPLDARPLAVPREALAFARVAAIRAHTGGLDVELVDSADGSSLGPLRSGPCTLSPWDRTGLSVPLGAAGRVAVLQNAERSLAWDLVEGRALGPDLGRGRRLDLSPDGTRVARAMTTEAEVLDARTGEVLWRSPRSADGCASVTFGPDGRSVYTSGVVLDPAVRRWSLDDGELLGELLLEGCVGAEAWAVSADGSVVAIAPTRRTVVLFDGELRRELTRLGLPPCELASLAFDAGGEVLVAALGEAGLRRWDLAATPARSVLEGTGTYVYTVALSPDGRRLVSGDFEGRLRLWDVGSRRQLACFDEHLGGGVMALVWSNDGRVVCAASGPEVTTLDAETGERLARLDTGARVTALARHPARAVLAVGTADDVRWLEPVSLRELRRVPGRAEVAWSADGSLLATATGDGEVAVLGADDLRERWRGGVPGALLDLAFEPHGTRLACLQREGVSFVDGPGEARFMPTGSARPMCLGWLPGDRVVLGQGDGGLSVWDVATGERVVNLTGHRGYVMDLELSRDGRVLATAGGDGTARLWHTD